MQRRLEPMDTWKEITARNPEHSLNYAKRWENIAASGQDIYGEARLLDALAERDALIVDAGCGTGRLSHYLANVGHRVIGVDIDPVLLDVAAKNEQETCTWVEGDLASVEIPTTEADFVISAGQVLTFIAPQDREAVVANLYSCLRPGGFLVAGFGAGRGFEFPEFFRLAHKVGFERYQEFSSWQCAPFGPDSDFLVAMMRKPA